MADIKINKKLAKSISYGAKRSKKTYIISRSITLGIKGTPKKIMPIILQHQTREALELIFCGQVR